MLRKFLLTGILLFFTSCALGRGLVNPPPPLSNPEKAAEVTVKRDSAFMGSGQTMRFTLDGREIYDFRSGDEFSFEIDSGEHFFGVKCAGGWQMSGNRSEIAQEIKPGKRYFFRLIPSMSRGWPYSEAILVTNRHHRVIWRAGWLGKQ